MIMTFVPRFVWFGVLLCGEEALGDFFRLFGFFSSGIFCFKEKLVGVIRYPFLYSLPCSLLQCVAGRRTKMYVYFKARLNSKLEE